MELRLRASSGSQSCDIPHSPQPSIIHTPPYQVVYLSREKFPIIPFARTAAAVLLPVASAPPPSQHPPVGSDGGGG